MKILIIGNKNSARDEFAEKIGEAFGLPVFSDGVAEEKGAAGLEDGVYMSSSMSKNTARSLMPDAIIDHYLVPKENKIQRYKMASSRIWAVYETDENGDITDTPAKGERGTVFEFLRRAYALQVTKRLNDKAGRTVVRAAIMKEYIGSK